MGEIRGSRASGGALHQGFVGLVEVVGEGDDGEDAGNQARNGRGEHEAVGEEGGDPLADAEVAGQELAQGSSQALASGLLVHALGALLLLELGERGTQRARDRVPRQEQAHLVGRHPEQRYVPGLYPLRYRPPGLPGDEEKEGQDQVKDPYQRGVGGEGLLPSVVALEDSLLRLGVAHAFSFVRYAPTLGVPLGSTTRLAGPRPASPARDIPRAAPGLNISSLPRIQPPRPSGVRNGAKICRP